MSLITSIIVTVCAKLGIDTATKQGFLPQSSYVKRAMEALKRDDLDTAVRQYLLAIKRREPSDLTDMAAEQIKLRIESHINKFQNRLSEIEGLVRPRLFSKAFWQKFVPSRRHGYQELEQEMAELQKGISILRELEKRMDK